MLKEMNAEDRANKISEVKNLAGFADLSPEFQALLDKLPADYLAAFSSARLLRQLEVCSSLTWDKAWNLEFFWQQNKLECRIISFDSPSLFSLLCGVLSASGLNIQGGEAFTLPGVSLNKSSVFSHGRRFPSECNSGSVKIVIDRFFGHLEKEMDFLSWEISCRSMVEQVLTLLYSADSTLQEKARALCNEMVVSSLKKCSFQKALNLLPLEINFEKEGDDFLQLRIEGQDTLFFLYSLSTALSLHSINILSVKIQTEAEKVIDIFRVTKPSGKGGFSEKDLRDMRLSILLTKEFSYVLPEAPDPYLSLKHFEQLLGILNNLESSDLYWENLISGEVSLKLARILGSSSFLWEDFIRIQSREFLPLLNMKSLDFKREELENELREKIEEADDYQQKVDFLNDFKDSKTFLIDLDHIAYYAHDFRLLSERLTILVEIVVKQALFLAKKKLLADFGRPLNSAGKESAMAVFGLGKLGGSALGYASDIELLFIYADAGATEGPRKSSNADFFSRLVLELSRIIRSKKKGIFEIDLRLRPYGKDGPAAVSLDQFCRYYSESGDSHAYERLALVRLRWISGEKQLGKQVERLRDQLLYNGRSLDLSQLWKLRAKQLKEKSKSGQLNAKYSPGALVDIEYSVQILQVLHNQQNPALRTASIHAALDALAEIHLLSEKEKTTLAQAYDFLRHLINGLRMLRGNAEDLFLPQPESLEFLHLARRLAYEDKHGLTAQQRLKFDFDKYTALVRKFLEKHQAENKELILSAGNIADIIFSPCRGEPYAKQVLQGYGIKNSLRAIRNLQSLVRGAASPSDFAFLALIAFDYLSDTADPDMALNLWEELVRQLKNKDSHFRLLLKQPLRLNVLLQIMAISPFLGRSIIERPALLLWITEEKIVRTILDKDDFLIRLEKMSTLNQGDISRLLLIERKRQLLRIGAQDNCFQVPFEQVCLQNSDLASAMLEFVFKQAWKELLDQKIIASENPWQEGCCLFAFGKLGGRELNYSSDLDIFLLYDGAIFDKWSCPEKENPPLQVYSLILDFLRRKLDNPAEGAGIYRLDFRLRPFGSAGPLASEKEAFFSYYDKHAALWEKMALIKLRPICGNKQWGRRILALLQKKIRKTIDSEQVFPSIARQRKMALKKYQSDNIDVKNSSGGIRDIEFLVQGLQLYHRFNNTALIANTLQSIDFLARENIIVKADASFLKEAYIFLRQVEHFLQIYENQQSHQLPSHAYELHALAVRMLGKGASAEKLRQELGQRMKHVQEICLAYWKVE